MPIDQRKYIHGEHHSFSIRPDILTDEFVIKEVFNGTYGPPELFDGMMTIVDVGANIGAFTVYAGIHSDADIFAFEPEPSNYEILLENITLNGLEDRVTAHNCAISAPGIDHVFMAKGEGGNSAANPTQTSHHTEIIAAITLDNALGDIRKPVSFLKIDTEGHEQMIIAGLSDGHLSKIGNFAIEYHGNHSAWGSMIRRLTRYHDLRILASNSKAYLYGGMIHGTRRIADR